MGGEGNLSTLMIGAPVAVLSVVFLYMSNRSNNAPIDIRLALAPALVILLVYQVPRVFSVTILGHHSCGTSYDSYLESTRSMERWIPLVFLSITIFTGWVAWRPYIRAKAT